MAISDKINSIKEHIAAAYTAIEGKGGLVPQNKNCFNLAGAIEQMPTGGATLNIAYSDTAPTDTSKLWVKSTKPENIDFSYLIDGSPMGYSALSVSLPYRMRHHPVAMLGTKIYVFGSSAYPKKNIHVFDVATNIVSTLDQTFDYSLDEGQAVTIRNKIYVLSCNKSSSGYYMYEYNPETNVMSQQKYFTAGDSSAMIAFENQIYTIGGTATNDYPHKFVYRYDPVGKAIITVGTLTNSLHKACSVSYGRYIYAFGGRSYQNSKYVPQLKVIRINVDTSEIVELDAAFAEEVYDMVALKLGKDIYLMGSYGQSSSVYHFDAETETLDPTPLSGVGFVNQTGVRGVQYGNVLYCMGGGLNSAASDASIGKFVGTIPLNQNDILVHEGETSSNYFELIPVPTRVQIGVKNVYKGNASNEAELVDAYLFNNEKYAWVNVNTGVALYKTLEESTWAEISTASADGTASTKWAVGDEKTMTLTTGEKITVQILGFNHDDLADNSGKAGITFGMKGLLATTYPMNALPSNINGWDSSEMRTSTMGILLSQLSDLQSVIKQVNKKATVGGQSTTIKTSADSLFLFSRVEVTGTELDGYKDEGTQYEYWVLHRNPADRIKQLGDTSGTSNAWWLRSSYISGPMAFCSINEKGTDGYPAANTTSGVCFGFCV